MQARLKLKPGQNGTKKLLARFGDRLVCVRYRYDPARRQRFTTVELIVAQGPWTPRPRPRQTPRSPEDMVYVRIAYNDAALRAKLKTLGALWRPRYNYGNCLGESRVLSASSIASYLTQATSRSRETIQD